MKFSELKKFFLFNLIGSLVVSALVAVVTVLIGTFNEVTWRVFGTLGMVIAHSLVSLMFIWDDERQDTFERLAFFINTIFVLIILSFLTSIFGIWKILSGDMIWKTYQTFFLVGFASLHADILSKVLNKETYMDKIIYTNFLVMFFVLSMVVPVIYIKNAYTVLGDMYYRIIGALGIVDGTLSILTIIFYKLYLHKHPQSQNNLSAGGEADAKSQRKGLSLWVWILLIYLFFQIIMPMSFILFGALSAMGR